MTDGPTQRLVILNGQFQIFVKHIIIPKHPRLFEIFLIVMALTTCCLPECGISSSVWYGEGGHDADAVATLYQRIFGTLMGLGGVGWDGG